jgi:hypothetical protein
MAGILSVTPFSQQTANSKLFKVAERHQVSNVGPGFVSGYRFCEIGSFFKIGTMA